ncbi:MAG: molybdenum cofactor biosynthesis protein MoaE [Thermoanaerobaculia bacterium]
MHYLTREPLDLPALIAAVRRDSDGGLAAFLGVVRNENDGRRVGRIEYTAYASMAELEMGKIARELEKSFAETRVAMAHRIGVLSVGEASVAIAASSAHRAEAFAACREAIEKIKARAPIWKKEME